MLIRDARPGDTRALLDIYAPFILDTAVTFETEIPSEEAFADRVRGIQKTHCWLVAEENGNLIGYAYGSPHRARAAYQWCVEVSAYLAPSARRRGVGRALYEALFARLREQGYVNAYAGMTLPNAASSGFHQAMGFTPVGTYSRCGFKQGRWHDTRWFEKRLAEPPGEPSLPSSKSSAHSL